jgi:hypothetical protein
MKVIIAGSRTINNIELVEKAIKESGFEITEVVCGCCEGVDTQGELWALKNGIPVKQFPADWKKFGKSAGPLRNKEMVNYGEALLAIHANNSKGTRHIIDYAKRKGIPVFVIEV